MIGKKEIELTSSERDQLEELIDEEFRKVILAPREKPLIDFFEKILKGRHAFRNEEDTIDIEVLDVFYYANCPLGRITVEPSYDYYDSDKTVHPAELNLDYYTYSHVKDIVVNVLDMNQVDYSVLTDNREFDTAIFWENRDDLEMKFISECWNAAIDRTGSTTIAFLNASDGSNGPIDLRNGYNLWRERIGISEYLENEGILIEKEKKNRRKGKKVGFLKRLFGR